MKLLIAAALAALTLTCGASQAAPDTDAAADCSQAITTIDMIDCQGKQMDAADRKLAAYLAAAQDRIAEFDSPDMAERRGYPIRVDLAATQKVWEAYRRMHCGDVYDVHADGTIRHALAATCNLELTQARTHDVWSAYLTYFDSTPPVLPEP